MSDLVDKGYTGQTVAGPAARAGVTVDVVSGPKPGYGFIVQPRRCVVKRTNGSINHCRRADRHYETALTANQGFHCLSQTPHCTADSTAASCSTRSSSASRKHPARTARARPVTGH